ncbi:MAG: CstA-like transporter-associated (seleno)protein [Burkholderiales bacterium]
MTRVLLDLLWWLGHHAWRAAWALSGDDAYERYLDGRQQGAADETPLTRARFYEQRTAQKWDRIAACGRCSDLTP